MAEIVNQQNISIELLPWTDSGFSLDWIDLKEELGGNLPTGVASLVFPRTEETMGIILDTTDGTLTLHDNNDGGYNFDMKYFIVERKYTTNSLEIHFNCVPDDSFFSDLNSGTYENITDAINLCYPGNIDKRVDSDQDNSQKIYQTCETNLNFLNRLLLSYKSGIVFGYTWDGLLLKDIIGINSFGKDENNLSIDDLPDIIGGGTGNLTNITPYSMTYSRIQNYPIVNPWTEEDNVLKETFQDKTPKNVVSIISSAYFICRSGFEDMIKNYIDNKTNLETEFNARYLLSGTVMPNNFRIGDIVKYKRAEDNDKEADSYTRCLVYSNEVYLGSGQDVNSPSGFKNFEWRTELRGIEPGPWTQIDNE